MKIEIAGTSGVPLSCLLAVLVAAPGCASPVSLVAVDHDGGGRSHAGEGSRPQDHCGNGIDDDANGAIDDRCPCGPGEVQSCFGGAHGERGVGVCADGVQTCVSPESEWGDWGDSSCEGDVLPDVEQCDGRDHDCDGAVDESCPCAAGDVRACGSEFLVGACRAGEQSCRADGTWSGCEGAVGPRVEICGNGVDENCDGTADERCECVPEPERCRDGIDNDCDGVIDEPACTPDWPPGSADAGVPECPLAGCATSPQPVHQSDESYIVPGWGMGITSTFNGSEIAIAYLERARYLIGGAPTAVGDGMIHIAHLDPVSGRATRPDAAVVSSGVFPDTQTFSPGVTALVWNGRQYVVAWETTTDFSTFSSAAFVARVGLDGRLIGRPVEVPGRNVRVAWTGSEYYVGWAEERGTEVFYSVHRFDESLTTIGPEVSLGVGIAHEDSQHNVAWSGDRLAVVLQNRRDEGGNYRTHSRLVIIDGDTVLTTTPLPDGPPVNWPTYGEAAIGTETPAVAWLGDRFVACWARLESWSAESGPRRSIQCRLHSEAGEPIDDAFEVARPMFRGSWGANTIALEPATSCSFYVGTQNELREIYMGSLEPPSGILLSMGIRGSHNRFTVLRTPMGPVRVARGDVHVRDADMVPIGKPFFTELVTRACE